MIAWRCSPTSMNKPSDTSFKEPNWSSINASASNAETLKTGRGYFSFNRRRRSASERMPFSSLFSEESPGEDRAIPTILTLRFSRAMRSISSRRAGRASSLAWKVFLLRIWKEKSKKAMVTLLFETWMPINFGEFDDR